MLERIVTFVILHEGLFIPGPGDLGKTFPAPTGAGKTLADLEMKGTQIGLIIKGRRVGTSYTGTTHFEVLVPWQNVKQCSLLPTDNNA